MKNNSAYYAIVKTLKKYSFDNHISIRRAKYAISVIHRFSKPTNTRIISELSKMRLIKLKLGSGTIELL